MRRSVFVVLLVAVGFAAGVLIKACGAGSDDEALVTTSGALADPMTTASDAGSTVVPPDATTTSAGTSVTTTTMFGVTTILPSSTAAPFESPSTTTTPVSSTAAPEIGTLDAPVPLGTFVAVSPDWRMAVIEADLDATETVLGHAPFNPEPEPGFQYVIVTLAGVYQGSEPGVPAIDWEVVAEGGSYRVDGVGCGVIPDSIYDITELRSGEEFTANVCVPVASGDIAGAMLLVQPFQYSGTYFALD